MAKQGKKIDLSFIQYVESDADFDSAIKNTPGLAVADVYAKAFGPCALFDQYWYNTMCDLSDAGKTFKIIRAQSDNIAVLKDHLACSAQPRFLFYKDGEKIEQIDGPQLPKIMELILANATDMD